MATIGLDSLYYAKVTENASTGHETYGEPKKLAKAMKASISTEIAEAILYADDGAAVSVKEFKSGKISLGIDDIGVDVAADLTGAEKDDNNVLVSSSENMPPYVAVGFRAKKPNGKYRYFWLYKVQFSVPGTDAETKGDNISFQTPTIEGTILRRNKPAANEKHPWKSEVTEGDTGVQATTINGWFSAVYEPSYPAPKLTALSIGSVALSPTFDPAVLSYTAETTNSTNTVTATASSGATAVITVNSSEHTSGQSATWTSGENTVQVVVTEGNVTKTYTVTVTKS